MTSKLIDMCASPLIGAGLTRCDCDLYLYDGTMLYDSVPNCTLLCYTVLRCATLYYSDGRPLYVVRALQHRRVTKYHRGVCFQVLAYENMFGSRRITYVLFVCQLRLHARHIL